MTKAVAVCPHCSTLLELDYDPDQLEPGRTAEGVLVASHIAEHHPEPIIP